MPSALSAAELTLYRQLFDSICAEMGAVLQRSAYSPNIKERRDFSCALFDGAGRLVAQGRDIPVHLGSMPASVAAALEAHKLEPGDVVLLNDPYRGGTHLPDITAVAAFFDSNAREPVAFLANRAHHADVGGISPGSLPLSNELFQEGLIIPPVKVVRRGRLQPDIVALVCANSRTPDERRADLFAQLASLHRGSERLQSIATQGTNNAPLALPAVFDALMKSSRAAMQSLVRQLPERDAVGAAVVELLAGQATIRVCVSKRGDLFSFDFSPTDAQQPGPFNAVRAITQSAVFYALRCLLPPEVPTTAGLLEAVSVITKPGTIVDALHPAAVAAGNVETSQRIVHAVFQALSELMPDKIPAASQGTMNNVLVGATDPGDPSFAYYETIAGGHGAGPTGMGLSARHSHMTNSLNTPIEALEHAYPLRVRRYAIRSGSGGAGKHAGGAGVIREYEFLQRSRVTLLRQSCADGPPGAGAGQAGAKGKATLKTEFEVIELPASCSLEVERGHRLTVETPGGGGWGAAT